MKLGKILCFLIIVILYSACGDDIAEQALNDHLEDYESPDVLWQIINLKGVPIGRMFDDVKHEADGLLPINVSGLWGFIDTGGVFVIPPTFLEAHPFKDGLSRVRDANGLFGFINKKGSYIVPPEFEKAGDVHSGLIRITRDSETNFINLNKKLLTKTSFTDASDFVNGYATVRLADGWHFIDSLGNVGEDAFDQINVDTSDAPALVSADGKWNYISSNPILNSGYDYAEPFYGQQTLVRKEAQWFILDERGATITSSSEPLMNLGYGCFAQRKNGQLIVSNRNGPLNLQGVDEVHRMYNGYMAYRLSDSWNWLDTTGQTLLPQPVSLAWDFEQGLTKFARSTGIGVIDTGGHIVLPPIYAAVRILNSNGLFAVQPQ